MLDGNYLCEGAVEKLVLAWKVQRGEWIDESEGQEVESFAGSSPEFYELLHKAGSSKFKGPGPIGKMTLHEYVLLTTALAPYESDGPEDTDEWNLFDTFLSKDKGSWRDPHDLSKMLGSWERYVVRRPPLIDRISNLTFTFPRPRPLVTRLTFLPRSRSLSHVRTVISANMRESSKPRLGRRVLGPSRDCLLYQCRMYRG